MLSVRVATEADSHDLWAWRNDPITRSMSSSTEHVPWEAHAHWFRNAITDPNRLILICESESEKCGMVRFDCARGEATVSINLAPQCRGKGLGALMLGAGIDWLTQERGPVRLVAVIRADNVASQRVFRRAGFSVEASAGDYLTFSREVSENAEHGKD